MNYNNYANNTSGFSTATPVSDCDLFGFPSPAYHLPTALPAVPASVSALAVSTASAASAAVAPLLAPLEPYLPASWIAYASAANHALANGALFSSPSPSPSTNNSNTTAIPALPATVPSLAAPAPSTTTTTSTVPLASTTDTTSLALLGVDATSFDLDAASAALASVLDDQKWDALSAADYFDPTGASLLLPAPMALAPLPLPAATAAPAPSFDFGGFDFSSASAAPAPSGGAWSTTDDFDLGGALFPMPPLDPFPFDLGFPAATAAPLATVALPPSSPVPSLEHFSVSRTASPDATVVVSPVLESAAAPRADSVADLDKLFADATANVLNCADLDAIFASVPLDWLLAPAPSASSSSSTVPALEPQHPAPVPPPAAPATSTAPVSGPTKPAKRPRRRPAGELPPIAVATPASSTDAPVLVIPTKTKKSSSTVASIPAVLTYPKSMIAHDAPIQRRGGVPKRTYDEMTAADEAAEVVPDPATVEDEAEAKRIKNALSARRSRARKLAKLEFLEAKVNDLESERAALLAKVAALTAQLEAGAAGAQAE
ncbi:hypothetical protein H9P43_007179 [Blastocladiella emersonii ATCC 22665]|nr:hypothetical protein H9P43_007179 [Blastocladiella emersonii ATCC 22665]